MRVGLLGPLDVRDDEGQQIALTGFRQRTLLALLALRPGVVTPAERLIEDLWAERDLQRPANALQVVVFKLRRTVGTDRIVTRPPGYLLDIADDDVDAHEFERLVHEGRAELGSGRATAAAGCFDRALGLWRGEALLRRWARRPARGCGARDRHRDRPVPLGRRRLQRGDVARPAHPRTANDGS
ncbi:MAG TPA: winged helix-turn-helix domain-containing protein, partial [Ilumatobacteraceae bacterium]|nr:winged helix-turn-helix domain-containing protein [Ilumatobacteraceae bacterium]